MLSKTTILAAVWTAGLAVGSTGQDALAGGGAGKQKPQSDRPAALLEKYDLNGNGKIDPEERKKIAEDRKKAARGKRGKPKTDRPPKTGGEPGGKGKGGGKKKGGGGR